MECLAAAVERLPGSSARDVSGRGKARRMRGGHNLAGSTWPSSGQDLRPLGVEVVPASTSRADDVTSASTPTASWTVPGMGSVARESESGSSTVALRRTITTTEPEQPKAAGRSP